MGAILRAEDISVCPDCGDTHIGRCGGLSFAQRLRSVRVDTSVTPSRTPRNYYEPDSIREVFGDDAKERMDDDTEGRGPVYRTRRGYVQGGEVVSPEHVARQFEGEERDDPFM